ncbi:MAG: PQQ-binding-like beta-propeller repeat protein [Defluviitaleaceae bacterium]|nr:PQQ-binding-like beta-propeller repeat protein [Defluviitaleaceae bacterium]
MDRKKSSSGFVGFLIGLILTFAVGFIAVGVFMFISSMGEDVQEVGFVLASPAPEQVPEQERVPEPIPELTPQPTPEPTPEPEPKPWELFTPHPLLETDPATFPRFSFENRINEYMTLYPIHFGMPENYSNVVGVTTFRGNNFRNNPTWGNVVIEEERLEIRYEIRTGSLGRWTGVGWTGQPAIVQWDFEIQQMMNIHEHFRYREGLVEVIQGAMDGFVYFFELETGEETRPRLHFNENIKGSVTVDARGYPLLYIGQGDNIHGGRFGYYIFCLITFDELFFINGMEAIAPRRWGAFDANPLFDTETDRVIIAGENSVIYSVLLNIDFDRAGGTISIDPLISRYWHTGSRRLGTENSPAAFGHYLFFADNAGWIQCLDLRTLEPVWVMDAGDDTDATLVLEWEEENQRLVIYTATQVDLVRQTGYAHIRKLDAATGETLWHQTIRCSYNTAVNGGVTATPVVGKHDISHLVIFSVARTLGRASSGTVIAFCKSTGDIVWEFPKSGFGWSSPVAVYTEDGTSYVIVSDSNGRMYMLRGATGEETYRINLGGNVEASPAVFGNMLVVGTRGQRIFGIEIS